MTRRRTPAPGAKSTEPTHDLAPQVLKLVECLADGVIMVDQKDRVCVINAAARRMLHLPADAPVGTSYLREKLGFYPFDLVRGWVAKSHAAIRDEVQLFDRVVHSVVSPVSDGNRLLGVAVLLRDITAERQAEKNREELLSIASHELLTPLTLINATLDILLGGLAGRIADEQVRHLEQAKQSCGILSAQVRKMLDLQRVEPSQLDLATRPLDLDALLREAIDDFSEAAEEKQVRIHDVLGEGSTWVRADESRIHQVMDNLLSNAIKFSREGGDIHVNGYTSAGVPGWIAIGFHNDGKEIAELEHERIFDRHAQSAASPARSAGLGLGICRQIIEAHGGTMWIDSGQGEGTRFLFSLPILARDSSMDPAASQPPPIRFEAPPRVLLVEADRAASYLLQGLLHRQGFRVQGCDNSERAIRASRAWLPDLLVAHLESLADAGAQLLQVLRSDPELQDIPLVLLQEPGRSTGQDPIEASAYLDWPVDPTRLGEAARGQLERRELIQPSATVLVVDNDDGLRRLCRELMERQGYSVVEAATGNDALALCQVNPVDAVLLDMLLPDLDGLQVLQRLRAERRTADVPVVIIGVRDNTADKVRALKLGADDYLAKPFDAMELSARVETLIKHRERASDASPTTRLPGSTALEKELSRRLADGRGFCLCYLDLDNLKAYNDYYSYAKADAVIHQTGELIRSVVEGLGGPTDFVGHIAGDDFVLITDSWRVEEIAAGVIESFDEIIPLYYHPSDRARGYIEAEDRFGQQRRFPIMTISLAAIHVAPGEARSPGDLAERAAAVKKKAKAILGSVLVQEGAAPSQA